jgi:glycosyltransferase involved in cell wall biosynthesis
LITVADRLRQAGVPFEIRIVGSGHMECRLRPYFSAEEMPGRVEPSEVGRYYEWADFFLLPSDFEGESLALLEAMAHGCVPVLGPFDSDVALKVSAEGLGYRGTVEGMIAYIKSFEGQAERLHALGVLNQQFLSNSEYRLDRVAAGYSDLFQRVVLQPPLELGEAKISRLLLKVYNTLLFSRFRGPVTRASLAAMRLK